MTKEEELKTKVAEFQVKLTALLDEYNFNIFPKCELQVAERTVEPKVEEVKE